MNFGPNVEAPHDEKSMFSPFNLGAVAKASKWIDDFYRELLDEIKDRVARGIAAVGNETFRYLRRRNWGQVYFVDIASVMWYFLLMARPLRIEFPGALYHVSNRARRGFRRRWRNTVILRERWPIISGFISLL